MIPNRPILSKSLTPLRKIQREARIIKQPKIFHNLMAKIRMTIEPKKK